MSPTETELVLISIEVAETKIFNKLRPEKKEKKKRKKKKREEKNARATSTRIIELS